MGSGDTKLYFGNSTEVVLSFTQGATLKYINPGQKSQSNRYLNMIVSNESFKHGESYLYKKNGERVTLHRYNVTLDLRGLTSSPHTGF